MESLRRVEHWTRLLSSEGAASVALYRNNLFLHNRVKLRRDSECELVLGYYAYDRHGVVCFLDLALWSHMGGPEKDQHKITVDGGWLEVRDNLAGFLDTMTEKRRRTVTMRPRPVYWMTKTWSLAS